MPATAPLANPAVVAQLSAFGRHIRSRRKALRVSATAAAAAAGISRVTLHRIESGEASVTMGAYLNAMSALGLVLGVVADDAPQAAAAVARALPASIRLADYPALARLAWHAPGLTELTPAEALSLYERNWRHLDHHRLSPGEQALLAQLVNEIGKGHLLV